MTVETQPKPYWENAPGHGHDVIGIWDSDNGERAGKTCLLCYRWNEFKSLEEENLALRDRIAKGVARDIRDALCTGPMKDLSSRMNAVFQKHFGEDFISQTED